MRLSRLLLLTVLMLVLIACAVPRYLTAEQDEEMREACEPAGCVTVPMPVWEEIARRLKMLLSV